jgi:hypothetical protein
MMTKKILFTLVIFASLTMNGYSQYSKKKKEKMAFNFGLKASGGSILSRPELTYLGNVNDYVTHEVTMNSTKPQWSFGAFSSKRFGWIYSEATAMYSTYGMSYDVKSYVDGNGQLEVRNERFSYADIQVMAGLTENGFRIGVGPVAHILVGHESEMKTLQNYNEELRKVSYGISGLIGYKYGPVCVEMKYDRAFRTIGDHIYNGYRKSTFRETPNALMFQVSYAIL